MQGLELSKGYFLSCRDALASAFPSLFARMAIGLVGHGSQCLDLDDEVSRDHDWGPQFCVFLEKYDFAEHGTALQQFLTTLPDEFRGFKVEWDARIPRERSGVLCTEDWFYEQLAVPVPFTAITDWLKTSDPRLLWVTNGEIWHDPLGRVTNLRDELSYYPADVWLRRIINKCLLVQILGPYQISRALKRGDTLLPLMTRGYFVREALHLVFLLNRRYAPFFKWSLPLFRRLPSTYGVTTDLVEAVLREADAVRLLERVQELTDILHQAVRAEFPDVDVSGNPLELGFLLFDRIEHPAVRAMAFWNQEPVS